MRTIQKFSSNRCARSAPWLLALALLVGCDSNQPKPPDPQKMLEMHREQALGYLDSGALPQAEDQVRKGLDISPKDDNLKLMLGWIRQRRGTRDDLFVAERVFRDLAPRKDYRALLGLAECLERKGVLFTESAEKLADPKHLSEAADPKKRAEELRSDAKKFWAEALTNYQAVLAARPSAGQGMNGLQRVYALLDRPEDSVIWGEKLVTQSAAEIVFWEKQLKRADLRAEEETRLRVLMMDTRELCVATHLSVSSMLVKLGRKSEAIAHLDSVVLLNPELSAAYSRRAQILFDLGRFEEARANLDDFLRLSSLPFDHADIQRALQTKADCDRRLQAINGPAK